MPMLPVPASALGSAAACRQAAVCLATVLDGPGEHDPEVQRRLRAVHRALVGSLTVTAFLVCPSAAEAKMYEWAPRRHYKRLGQIREEANQMILEQASLLALRQTGWKHRACDTMSSRRARRVRERTTGRLRRSSSWLDRHATDAGAAAAAQLPCEPRASA